MELSVIIVNWNSGNYLIECLNSLMGEVNQAQTEIIVVDNASSDGSVDIVEKRFPGVVTIRNSSNLGFAKANNIGIRQSQGEYLCLINSDVVVRKGCIKQMLAFMDQHRAIGMLGPKILNPDLTLQPSCREFPSLWNSLCRSLALDSLFRKSRVFGRQFMSFWTFDSVRRVDILSGCFWLLRREAVDQIGLLDETFFIYSEDQDWCKRFWKSGWEVVYFPQAQAIHYGEGSSSREPIRFFVEMQRANLQYWRKHHTSVELVFFYLLSLVHHLIRLSAASAMYVVQPSKRQRTLLAVKRSLYSTRFLLHL